MTPKPDWLVVGAGFTGSVLAERIASELKAQVLLIDRRPHVGGNAYDERDAAGVLIHRYGPHIFHTNSDRVWTYLSRFTRWRGYEHRVLGFVDGQLVPVPFNLISLRRLMEESYAPLSTALINAYGYGSKVPIMTMRSHPDPGIRRLADFIYEKVFLNYTIKQWGRDPTELDASVTARVPVLVSDDDRYFQDRYQAMPADGYSVLFARLLDHPLIDVQTDTVLDDQMLKHARHVIYTGPIDEFFGHAYGALEYRTLRFEFETHGVDRYQSVGTHNYPNDFDYTRITEFKHITGQRLSSTTIVREYPSAHVPSVTEPYYPVPRPENRERYALYARAAAAMARNVVFCGRLADYRYYNMDQAVGRALAVFDKVVVPLARGRQPESLDTAGV